MNRYAYSGARPPEPGAPPSFHAIYERMEEAAVYDVMHLPPGAVVVHGACPLGGIDAAVSQAARELGLVEEAHPPKPEEHGGDRVRALLARNAYVTTVGAVGEGEARFFAAPWSRGTYRAWELAVKANVPRILREYLPDGGVRITRYPELVQRHRVRSSCLRGYGGPGRLDVTHGSGRGEGRVFAPTEEILKPALAARERSRPLFTAAGKLRDKVRGLFATDRAEADQLEAQAWAIEEEAWGAYLPLYTAEMRVSAGLRRTSSRWGALEEAAWARGVRAARPVWDAALAGKLGSYDVDGAPLTVACCYCTGGVRDRGHCHSIVLRGLWAAMGAEDGGEAQGPWVGIVCIR